MRLIAFFALVLLTGCSSDIEKDLSSCQAQLNTAQIDKKQALEEAVAPLNKQISLYQEITKEYEQLLELAKQKIQDAEQTVSIANYCDNFGKLAFFCDDNTREIGKKLEEQGYMPDFITSYTLYALTFLIPLTVLIIPFGIKSVLGFSTIREKNKNIESITNSQNEKEEELAKREAKITAMKNSLNDESVTLNTAIRAKQGELKQLTEQIDSVSKEIERLNKVKNELSELESIGKKF